VQAVEGAYKTENGAKIEASNAKHATKRNAILTKLAKSDLSQTEQRFLDRNFNLYPRTNLETALHWSAKLVQSDIATTLKQEAIVAEKISDGSAETWAAALRIVRNDLPHGNRSYSSSDLDLITEPLRRHVTSLMLYFLGASVAAQKRGARKPIS
jgi:hypothetical protein